MKVSLPASPAAGTASPKVIIGVSLKMYFGYERTLEYCREVAAIAFAHPAVQSGDIELFVLPTLPALPEAARILGTAGAAAGAQDIFWEDEGAFTGEVGGKTVAELGGRYAEVGHAERRRIFGEDDRIIGLKTAAAYRNGLTPVLCVGELQQGSVEEAVARCTAEIDAALNRAQSLGPAARTIVAYEPQWAIGAPEPATPALHQRRHRRTGRAPARPARPGGQPGHLRRQRRPRPDQPAGLRRRRACSWAASRTTRRRSRPSWTRPAERLACERRWPHEFNIGLSSYAFFWQLSDKVTEPLTIHQALEKTAALGVELFQICDYAPLEAMTDAELEAVRATADRLGIALELGTKGIRPEHLRKFLHIAGILGAPLLRTMFNVPGHTPTAEEAVAIFKEVLPEFEAAGVKIAVETYEQVPTSRILDVIRGVDSPYLGICSDPANTSRRWRCPAR